MKAIEQYFPVVLFIMLYNVVLAFESVDEILKCGHSNESYWAVLSCGVVYYAAQRGSTFWVCGWNPKVWPFKCTVYNAVQGRSNFLREWIKFQSVTTQMNAINNSVMVSST